MEIDNAVAALGGIAQPARLEIFRLLVRHGRSGLLAGKIGGELDLLNATLDFHLARLRHAGLVSCRRQGHSLIYAANFESMNSLLAYLTENCCREGGDACAPGAFERSSAAAG
ncbi:MAG: helix-turn-helix domain-containing protein, partial [Alphaproteobacteria bacterium]